MNPSLKKIKQTTTTVNREYIKQKYIKHDINNKSVCVLGVKYSTLRMCLNLNTCDLKTDCCSYRWVYGNQK